MGACSDYLSQILAKLGSGVGVLNKSSQAINPATEDGHIQDILTQINKLTFEQDDNALKVQLEFDPSSIKIGDTTLEDPDSGTKANISLDTDKNALYVRSNSLLNSNLFSTIMGDGSASPSTNTIGAYLLALENYVNTINTQTNKLTFSGNALQVTAPDLSALAKDTTLASVETNTDSLVIANSIVATETIHFNANLAASTIQVATDLSAQANPQKYYLVSVRNSSTETDVDIQLYLKETFGTDVTWCLFGDNFTVLKSPDTRNPDQTNQISAKSEIIQGAYFAQGLGISAKLIEGTDASGSFDLKFVIRELGGV